MNCIGRVNQGEWCQESYETASREAGKRARQLRKAGFEVTTFTMGVQVTPAGLVRLTMVDIKPGAYVDTFALPDVEK